MSDRYYVTFEGVSVLCDELGAENERLKQDLETARGAHAWALKRLMALWCDDPEVLARHVEGCPWLTKEGEGR